MSGSPVIWQPSAKLIAQANVTRFMKHQDIRTLSELMQRATTGVEWFWDASLHETDVSWFEPYTRILDDSRGIAEARWFLGGRINITENCVDRHARNKKTAKKIAYHWQGECGAVKSVTYEELAVQTNQVAAFLKEQGVGVGDFVGLYMPMLAELIPVFFATFKVGAILVPVFSGFGADAVATRFQDAGVKVVFTADGTLRKGKEIPVKEVLDEALLHCPSVKTCVVVRRLFQKHVPMRSGRDIFYDEAMACQRDVCPTEELPSEHPCMVLYTSGTTGKPKGTMHTHAGVLAQVSKEHYFHFDLKPHETFFWVTDIGWMMGPWMILGASHFGASFVLIEGSPTHPKVTRVFDLCSTFSVSHLGISPTFVRLLMRELQSTEDLPSLSSLRILGSTGEPWDEESYLWFFKNIGKSKLPIINISGGTEIMGCLLAPLPVKELKACSLQGPALGMAVDIFLEGGYAAPLGEVGYLVCKKPAPSMTKGFLNDRERYLDTYFSRFKNVWNHGDWAVRDEDGHWFLRGRADDTIKIAGKRVGPSEVESCLCDHRLVSEACAIGVPDALKGESLVCFVVLKNHIGETAFLLRDLKDWVSRHLGKTLHPSVLYIVATLPKTRSGKIVRGTIKRKYLGQDLGDLASLENPELLNGIPQQVTDL